MKVQRQRKIVELITEKDIETQEELAKCLVDDGLCRNAGNCFKRYKRT